MNNQNPLFFILQKIPLFKDLSEESNNLLTQSLKLEYFPKNHIIFSQGDVGDALYIIKRGMVKIYQGNSDDPDEQVELAILNDNSFFGEMALISDQPRNAHALTLEESEIFVLTRETFDKLVQENPTLAEQISSEFIHRVKDNSRNENFQDN